MSDQSNIPSAYENFSLAQGGTDLNAAQPQQHDSELVSGFLRNIPEGDREVVGRYVRDWDRGVQGRFQEIHDSYRPFKDLGADYPTMLNALQVWQMLNNDPERMYDSLREWHDSQQQQADQQSQQYADLPPQFAQEFQQMKQFIQTLGQDYLQSRTQSNEAREDAELDEYMSGLRQQYGEYDEPYVLAQMQAGMDGPQAVAAYQNLVQSLSSSPRPMVRPLSGGGAVGSSSFDPKKASGEDVKSMVAQMLAAAASEGQ